PSSFPGARQADLDGACRALLRTSLSKRLMRDARLRLQDRDFDAALGLALPDPTLEGLLLIGRPGRLGHLLSEPAVTIRVREAQAARGKLTPLPLITALQEVMDEVACLTRGDPSSPAFFDLMSVRSAIAWTLQCRDYTVHRPLQVQIARDLITVSAPLARDIQAPLLDGYLALLDPSLLCPLWLRLNEKALLLGGELPRVEEIDGEIRTIIPVCRPSEEWQAIASRLREELGPREDRRQLAACLLVLRVMSALRKSSFESLQGTVPLSAEELADALRTLLRLELLVECQSGIIFRAPQDPIFLQNPRLLLAMDLLEERGYLTRDGLAGHLQLPQHMAYALLRRLTDEGYLRMEHTGRAVQYLPSHRNIRFLIPDAEKNTPETTT
ncbi:MAG: hypothetical protein IJ083_03550, partial [Clostridia bacterium]|nr:hypothetical protein [Clostridia bacterium]